MTKERLLGFLTGLFLLIVTGLRSQSTVSGDFHNVPLADAFRDLEHSAGITVSYEPNAVKTIRVTAVFSDLPLAEAFELLLRETPLTAEVVRGRHVLIRRRGEPARELTTLCGRTVDRETGEALPYVTLISRATRQGIQSDESGRFSWKVDAALTAGDTLVLQYVGYEPQRIPAGLLAVQPCTDIDLRAATRELVTITVSDLAVEAIDLSHGKSTSALRPDRAGFVPGLGEPDPFRLIQFLPGIGAEGDKADGLLVRGGSSDQNLVLWEDIPIYHTGHLFGLVTALNPYVVNRVNVWKGNYSADYGGRASSLIDLRTAPRLLTKPCLAVGVNLVSTYFSLEIPLFHGRGGLLLAGRRAFSGILESPVYQQLFGFAIQNSRIRTDRETQQSDSLFSSAFRVKPSSSFSDGNLKFFWQINAKTRLETHAYAGMDRLYYQLAVDLRDYGFYYQSGDTVEIVNLGSSIGLHRQWTESYASAWRLAWSDFSSIHNYAGTLDFNVPAQYIQNQENTLRETVFRFDNTWRLGERQELQFGFQSIKTTNYFREQFYNQPNPDQAWNWVVDLPSNQSAFYGIWRMGDTARLSFEAGMRQVTFNYAAKPYWEPRLALRWQLTKTWRWRANAGIFHQFMRKAYVWNDLGLNNEAWFTADDNGLLPVLENRQVSTGFSYARRGWWLDVEGYYKFLNNLTGLNFRFNGQPQAVWNARGTETAQGIEVLLRKKWGLYTHWLSYTYGRAEMHFDSLNQGSTFPADFDQRHGINWAHHFGWKHWSLALAWNFRSGRPFTPPTGVDVQPLPDGGEKAEIRYGMRNAGRLPSYERLDASVQYHFNARSAAGTVGLSVYNVNGRVNLDSREFFVETTYDAQGQPHHGIGVVERTLLGRMVNLFLLVRWQ